MALQGMVGQKKGGFRGVGKSKKGRIIRGENADLEGVKSLTFGAVGVQSLFRMEAMDQGGNPCVKTT